jgi:hypothetical protein
MAIDATPAGVFDDGPPAPRTIRGPQTTSWYLYEIFTLAR